MTKSEKTFLLKLARRSINYYLDHKKYLKILPEEIMHKNLIKKQGSFVTLKLHGHLKGCIGHIEAVNPIYLDIVDNAVSAAFFDPRFSPIVKDDLKKLEIEISLLSIPQKIIYRDTNELLEKIKIEKPGIILKKDSNKATFLPQVWENIASPEDFLSHLCLKAGLSPLQWKSENLEIYTYSAEVFKE